MTSVSPTTSSAAAPPATSATANGATANGALTFTQNFNTFLTLLTTQLQNQDPLSPMDTDQFTNQLVMFSQVEQQLKTNSELTTMIGNQTSAEAISAVPMVGNTIEYTGNQTVLENGQATFSYTLPSAAASATLVVQDSSGNTVYSQPASTDTTQHSFTWNGQTNDGQQLPDGGTYTFQVLASNANNQAITPTYTATGTITGVSVNNNVATFNLSGVQVPMSNLINIVSGSSSSNSST